MNSLNILYLDDNQDLLDLYSSLIQDLGFQIKTFVDPCTALSCLSKKIQQFDVLLVDYSMPKMNGVEFIDKILKEGSFTLPNVALFSSMAQDINVQKELEQVVLKKNITLTCIEKSPNNFDELKNYLQIINNSTRAIYESNNMDE